VKVSPSAPVVPLDPMDMSKDAVIPAAATGVGQNAEPACQVVFGVSCRLGGDALVLSTDEPFSCHPPAVGDGMATGAAAAACALTTPVTKPAMTSDVITVIPTALSRRAGRRECRICNICEILVDTEVVKKTEARIIGHPPQSPLTNQIKIAVTSAIKDR
jgi:hypothetical protein